MLNWTDEDRKRHAEILAGLAENEMQNPRPVEDYIKAIAELHNTCDYGDREEADLIMANETHFEKDHLDYTLAECLQCTFALHTIANKSENPVWRELAQGLLHYRDYKP